MQRFLWLFSVAPRAVAIHNAAKPPMFEQRDALYLKQMQ